MVAGSLNIPKFHTKDFTVLVASMLPMAVLLNYFLYGTAYFNSAGQFLLGFEGYLANNSLKKGYSSSAITA